MIYSTSLGGNFAVGGSLTVHNNFSIGTTHSSLYNPTLHRGEYVNSNHVPSLLFGGDKLTVAADVQDLNVIGGTIAMTTAALEENENLSTGFTPKGVGSGYQSVGQEVVEGWFAQQQELARTASECFATANDERVSLTVEQNDFVNNAYMAQGPERFENSRLTIDGEVYANALFITVTTDGNLELGTWWPLASSLQLNSNWVRDYDLMVFSFPDAINVTMAQQSLMPDGAVPWPTTVDAHLQSEGLALRQSFARKVVYNFPKAENITADQTMIQGTVLAPNATFRGIGGASNVLFGRLIVQEYIGENNFSIHDYGITTMVEEMVADVTRPTQQSYSLILEQHLILQEEAQQIPVGGGEFILFSPEEDGNDTYYAGKGVFVSDETEAAVYSIDLERETLITDLPLGTYTLRQIAAPEGFVLNTTNPEQPTYFEQVVRLNEGEKKVEVLLYTELEGMDLHFIKVDADNPTLVLKGAKFGLIREGDQFANTLLWGEYLSGADGRFDIPNLPIGNYHLVEGQSPDGYQLPDEEVYFAIHSDDGLKMVDANGVEQTSTVDSPIAIGNVKGVPSNSIVVVKYAKDEKNPSDETVILPEAQFDLYKKNQDGGWNQVTENALGEPIAIETSDLGYDRVENLATGTYRLTETVAPIGYALYNEYADEDFPGGRYAYEFEFSEGPVSSREQYIAFIPNTALTTEVTLQNVGLFLADLQPLDGSEFRLERQVDSGTPWEDLLEYHSVQTDENGEIHFSDLTYGRYRLTQVEARNGYTTLTPARIFFTIAFDGESNPHVTARYNSEPIQENSSPVSLVMGSEIIFTVENEANTVAFSVYKNAEYENMENKVIYYLEGATFRLRYRERSDTAWRDYGEAFTSRFLYKDGEPVLDGYGNPVASAQFNDKLLAGFHYSLVEVEMPENYQTASSIAVTLEDGTIGYEVQRYLVTEEMADENGKFTYTVVNYPEKERLTVYHFDKSKASLVEANSYEVKKGATLEITNYLVEIEDYLAVHYQIGEETHALSVPMIITQAIELEIYYASTIINISLPSEVAFYAYHTDGGVVTSEAHAIINQSEMAVQVNFQEMVTIDKDLAGIDFVANATKENEMHLDLKLPESAADNPFQTRINNIAPDERIDARLGILEGTFDNATDTIGTFAIGGRYVGSFPNPAKNPQISFLFSFELSETMKGGEAEQ